MNTAKLVKIALVVLALFVVYRVATQKREKFDAIDHAEYFEDGSQEVEEEEFTSLDANETLPPGWTPTARSLPSPPPMSTAANLLPKPRNDAQDFSEFAPKALQGVNLLDASAQIGTDTQTSSLKISSWDVRGFPGANPRVASGPWQQSTVSADLLRKSLN